MIRIYILVVICTTLVSLTSVNVNAQYTSGNDIATNSTSTQSYSDDNSTDDRTPNYKYAFGLKVSPPNPLSTSSNYGFWSLASFRLFFDQRTAWEANAIVDPEQWQINSYYERFYPLSKKTYKSFRFFWGAGIHYGYNYYFAQRNRGISSTTGIDYTFKSKTFPYAISLDIGPYVPDFFSKNIKVEVHPNIAFRYCFDY